MNVEFRHLPVLIQRSYEFRSQIIKMMVSFFCTLFVFMALLPVSCAAEKSVLSPKKVLILPSYNINYPGSRDFLDGLFDVLDHAPFSVTYYHENLLLSVHPGDDRYLQQIAASLKIKYATDKPDIIIVQSKPATQFMTKYGKEIFGNVPVVFSGFEAENFHSLSFGDNYTGLTAAYSAERNLALITKNHPNVRKIYVIAGAGAFEHDLVKSTLAAGEKYSDQLQLVVLDQQPIENLLETIKHLEPDSAILYLVMQNDSKGTVIMPAEMAKNIGNAANVPAYGILNTYMGSGLVGGFLVDLKISGQEIAKIAMDILSGGKPSAIPIRSEVLGAYRFDWRQLKRWNISENLLPAASSISFKEITLWELYKKQIIAGVSLLLLQAALIAILLINRKIRKKAQLALEKSESQLQKSNQELNVTHEELTASYEELLANEEHLTRLYDEVLSANEKLEESNLTIKEIFNAVNDIIIVIDPDNGKFLAINQRATELFGYSEEEFKTLGLVTMSTERYLTDALQRIHQTVVEGPQLYERETLNRFGSPLTLEINSTAAVIQGKRCCLSVLRDISQRKLLENRLTFLSMHDPLTALYNRSYFEEQLFMLQNKKHQNLGVFVCDIDGLKLINDTLGHPHGDALLKAAADILKQYVVIPNFAARIGGDEFAVVRYDADRHNMDTLYQQYKDAIHDYNETNPQLPLSLSMGWALSRDDMLITDLIKEADNNMYRQKVHQQKSIRSSIVKTMMKALEVRDHITEGHAERLGDFMEQMAKELELPPNNIADLRLFAQFHDIGKVGIPDNVLNKPGKLTEEEMTIMRQHSEIGFRIARSSPELAPIADWILKHHEHWDGDGYPLGIAGEEIPIECRLLAIIDAYDAMTSDRSYRKAMKKQQAIDELRRCEGTQFDKALTEFFIEAQLKM